MSRSRKGLWSSGISRIGGCFSFILLYYIFDAIFSIFSEIKMVFPPGIIYLSDEEIIPLEHLNK